MRNDALSQWSQQERPFSKNMSSSLNNDSVSSHSKPRRNINASVISSNVPKIVRRDSH